MSESQQGYGNGGWGQQGYDQYPAAAQGQQIPPTNAGWAVASLIFFWPLAFVAFTASSDVVRLWTMGDHAGAHAASAKAKRMGKISLIIVAVVVVLYVAALVAAVSLYAGSTS